MIDSLFIVSTTGSYIVERCQCVKRKRSYKKECMEKWICVGTEMIRNIQGIPIPEWDWKYDQRCCRWFTRLVMISEDWLFSHIFTPCGTDPKIDYMSILFRGWNSWKHLSSGLHILTSGTFVVTRHAWFARTPRLERDVGCSDQMSLTGFDKTRLQETHATGTLRKKLKQDLTRSWQLHGPIERSKRWLYRCLLLCRGSCFFPYGQNGKNRLFSEFWA